jgi:hypothetical protein
MRNKVKLTALSLTTGVLMSATAAAWNNAASSCFTEQCNPFSEYQNPFSEYQNPFSEYQNPFSEYQNPFSKEYIPSCTLTGGC